VKTARLLQVDTCKHGHDVTDKENSLRYRQTSQGLSVACRACMNEAMARHRAKQVKREKLLPISLLDVDYCSKGHDIRNKDESLRIYTSRTNQTYLKCKECHKEFSRRYLRKFPTTPTGKPRSERAILRATHDSEPRQPQSVKADALALALRNEIYAIATRLTDTELLELVLELRKRG
jgi:glycerol-3-phosphate cytidylyltransferase-like family protein